MITMPDHVLPVNRKILLTGRQAIGTVDADRRRGLTQGAPAGTSRAMRLRTTLADLRRSGLGAWLACLYGLALLAAALAPQAAHAQPLVAALCSGQSASPAGDPAGGDDEPHCATCLPLPAAALLPASVRAAELPSLVAERVAIPFRSADAGSERYARPQPRAPPAS